LAASLYPRIMNPKNRNKHNKLNYSQTMSKQKSPYKSLRYFIVSIILLALLACVIPFFIQGPDNKKLISPDQIKLPEIKFLKKQPQDSRSISTSKEKAPGQKLKKIYKWEDKEGVLHFTDYPNPNGPSQLIMATPDRPDDKTPAPKTESLSDHKGKDSDDNPSTFPFPMTLSPSQIKKLKQDAEKIRKDIEKRYEDINRKLE
jgi:Domain of unknown function (DUF4124)